MSACIARKRVERRKTGKEERLHCPKKSRKRKNGKRKAPALPEKESEEKKR